MAWYPIKPDATFSKGDAICLVAEGSRLIAVKATSANLASSPGVIGVAGHAVSASTTDAEPGLQVIESGHLPGLLPTTTGAVSLVRVNAEGACERVASRGAGVHIVGLAAADGTLVVRCEPPAAPAEALAKLDDLLSKVNDALSLASRLSGAATTLRTELDTLKTEVASLSAGKASAGATSALADRVSALEGRVSGRASSADLSAALTRITALEAALQGLHSGSIVTTAAPATAAPTTPAAPTTTSALRLRDGACITLAAGALDNLGSQTVEMWVRLDALPAVEASLFNMHGEHEGVFWIDAAGALWFRCGDALRSDANRKAADFTFTVGVWTHVAAVVDRRLGRVSFVVNGARRSDALGANFRAGTLTLGASPPVRTPTFGNRSGNSLDGAIRDVRVWSVARTPAEIVDAQLRAPTEAERSSLLGWWPLEEGGGTTAQDRSGRGRDGTISGNASWEIVPLSAFSALRASARPCLRLDRHDTSAVQFLGEVDRAIGDTSTVELWLRPELPGMPGAALLQMSQGGFALCIEGDRVYANWSGVTGGAALTPGRWNHIAITRNKATGRATIRVYVEGQPAGTDTVTETSAGSGSSMTVQRFGDNLLGLVADLRVWGRERTADQIRALRSADPDPSDADLLAWWPMDEGAGGVVLDRRSGGNAHGVVVNGSWSWDTAATGLPKRSRASLSQASPVAPGATPPAAWPVFDGVGSALLPFTASLALAGSFTVEIWVRSDAFGDGARFFAISGAGGQLGVWLAEWSYRYGASFAQDGGRVGELISTRSETALTRGTWHHLALVRDLAAGQLRLVKDGVSVETVALERTTGVLHHRPDPVQVGRNHRGALAELRVWEVARTDAEIAANRKTRLDPATQTGLLGCWPLDDQSTLLRVLGQRDLLGGVASGIRWETLASGSAPPWR